MHVNTTLDNTMSHNCLGSLEKLKINCLLIKKLKYKQICKAESWIQLGIDDTRNVRR